MKKNQPIKQSTLKNKLVAVLMLIFSGMAVLIDHDITILIFLTPISLLLFFYKYPIIGKQDEDFPWGGKK